MKFSKEGIAIELTSRQQNILKIVSEHQPISGEYIAERLETTRPVIRSDLALLVMLKLLEAKPKVGYTLGSASRPGEAALERLLSMQVKEFQSVPIVLPETATVSDAVISMFLDNVGSLIIGDAQGNIAGIVSRKDLLKVTLGNGAAAAMPVSLIMTRHPNIVTVTPEESIVSAAKKMIYHEVDSLPVVREMPTGEISPRAEAIGRITKTAMTKVLIELALGH